MSNGMKMILMKRVDVALTKRFEQEYMILLKKYFNSLARATKEIDFSAGLLTKKFKGSLKKHAKMYGRGVEDLYKTTFKTADDAILKAFMEEMYNSLPEKFRYHGKKYKILTMKDVQLFEYISGQWVKSSINNYATTSWVWDKPALDGIKLSYRIWQHTEKSAEDIKKTLLINLQKGMSAERMATQLLKTQELVKPDIPDYVWDDIKLLNQDASKQALKKYFDKKLRFNAMRAARTEIQRAWRGSYVTMTQQLDFVKGIKWNLSHNHPKLDICDRLAYADIGLGQGVYPKNAVPFDGGPAHPQCMCYLTSVIDSVEKWLGEDESPPEVKKQKPTIVNKAKLSKKDFEKFGLPQKDTGILHETYQEMDYLSQKLLSKHWDDLEGILHIPVRNQQSAYYPTHNKIVIRKNKINKDTLKHELGHFVDNQSIIKMKGLPKDSVENISSQADGVFAKTVAEFKEKYLGKAELIDNICNDLGIGRIGEKGTKELSDIISGMTRIIKGNGIYEKDGKKRYHSLQCIHRSSYWEKEGNIEAEVFAELWTIRNKRNKNERYRSMNMLNKYFPGLWNAFVKTLKEML